MDMTRSLFGFLLAVSAFAQPTVSNVRTDWKTHSSIRFKGNATGSPGFWRVRFGPTSAYGDTLQYNYNPGWYNDIGFPLTGLKPNTTYHASFESSFDGTTWSTPADLTFTTLAVPATHPAPPNIPAPWLPTYPNTTGYTAVSFDVTCTETSPTAGQTLSQAWLTAMNNQATTGAVFSFAAGANCVTPTLAGHNDPQDYQVPSDSSHVNTSTGVFTVSNSVPSWTLTNGQIVRLYGSCLPDSITHGNGNNTYNPNGGAAGCQDEGQLTPGVNYCISAATATTFQLLNATCTGSPIIPGDVGNRGFAGGFMSVQQWPPMNSNWIVFRPATPDAQFCPFGTTCLGSIWQSKMYTLSVPGGSQYGAAGQIAPAIGEHHLWIMGAEITYSSIGSGGTSTIDPLVSGDMLAFGGAFGTSYIVFDRNYMHCNSAPGNRCGEIFFSLGSSYIALLGNDVENINLWRTSITPTVLLAGSGNQGFAGTVAGQTLTLKPGSTVLGFVNTCTSTANITFTFGGSTTGTVYVWVGPDCTMTAVAPTGTTGSCTGNMTDQSSVSHNCFFTTAATPDWNRDGNNGINCGTTGTIGLTGGTLASSFGYQATYGLSQSYIGEGSYWIASANGPGPFTFLGNYLGGTFNIPIHFDDSSIVDSTNVLFKQNSFIIDQSHRMGSASSDGRRYTMRNGLESKHIRQLEYIGNIHQGFFADVSNSSPQILFHTGGNAGTNTPNDTTTTQDVDIRYNTFNNGTDCAEFGTDGLSVPAAARIRFAHNICSNSNGYTQVDGNAPNAYLGGYDGIALQFDYAIEDLIVDHNLFYNMSGIQPNLVHGLQQWIEGFQWTNNISTFSANNNGFTSETGLFVTTPAISGTGSALFNSWFTSDPSTPGGIISNNLALPGYVTTGPGTPSGIVSASSICTNWGGTTMASTPLTGCTGGTPLFTAILNQTAVPLNVAQIQFTNYALNNYKLLYSSPYISGAHLATDGTDLGPDMNALLTAQGAVGAPTVSVIGTTTATISWWAYDGTVACAVDYAVAPNDPSTQTGGGRQTSSAGNSQSVTITAAAHSAILYRVLCPVVQPSGSFQLR